MKNLIFIIALSFFTGKAFSQLNDGKYVYYNANTELELTISEGGWKISSATLLYTTEDNKKITVKGTGEFVNSNGVQWYTFQAEGCSYDMDSPKETAILNRHDCNNGEKPKEFKLIRDKRK